MTTENQEKQRINQLLASDKAFSQTTDSFYYRALNVIKNHLRAFYVRYAGAEGLTVDQVKQRVTHWDLGQFMAAIDEVTYKDKPSKELTKRIKWYKYRAASGDRGDLIGAIVGVSIAVTANHVVITSTQHIADDYVAETKYQKLIAGDHFEWHLPHEQGVQITPAIRRVVESSDWSDRVWNHSDSLTADAQKVVRDALNSGMDKAGMDKMLAHLAPAEKRRGNLESAAKERMWMVDRVVRTESARVTNEAIKQRLRNSKTALIDIVGEPDACQKICRPLIAGGPYTMESLPYLPAHPNDRCRYRPHEEAIT